MTNHIEELMKAAGIKPETVTDYELNEYKVYPDFTPAKQLELIKLIATGNGINYHFNLHKYKLFDKWVFTSYVNTGGARVEHRDFEQGLVVLILRMISEGNIDKSEVKRILKDG